MKLRFTITVDLEDANHYDLDADGWPTSDRSVGKVEHQDAAGYIADAVSSWGGQFAPGDPFFPQNIRSVRVRNPGQDIDLEVTR